MSTKLILASVGLIALTALPTNAEARDRRHRHSHSHTRVYVHSAPVYRSSYVVRDRGYYRPYRSRHYYVDHRYDRHGHRHHHHHHHGLRGLLHRIFH